MSQKLALEDQQSVPFCCKFDIVVFQEQTVQTLSVHIYYKYGKYQNIHFVSVQHQSKLSSDQTQPLKCCVQAFHFYHSHIWNWDFLTLLTNDSFHSSNILVWITGEKNPPSSLVNALLQTFLCKHLQTFRFKKSFPFCCFSAPEVVNYEPLGLEADMW